MTKAAALGGGASGGACGGDAPGAAPPRATGVLAVSGGGSISSFSVNQTRNPVLGWGFEVD